MILIEMFLNVALASYAGIMVYYGHTAIAAGFVTYFLLSEIDRVLRRII